MVEISAEDRVRNERIAKVRQSMGLSQAEFAKHVNLGLGTIKNIEYSRAKTNSRFVSQIISACNVNPEWLETGAGEMFRKLTREEEIADFVGKTLAHEPDSFMVKFMSVLAKLDEPAWQKIQEAAEAILEAERKARAETDSSE